MPSINNRLRRDSALLVLLTLLILTAGSVRAGTDDSAAPAEIPVKDTVTVVELGADNCLPCRMLAPIIEELQGKYQGRAAVISINVYRERDLARKFHALVTPTLIFFDRHGKEVLRYSGFMDKETIVKQLDELLAGQER